MPSEAKEAQVIIPPNWRDMPRQSTPVAAALLLRKEQTLRKWACFEDGPIRPIRIRGRLAWPTAEIVALLNGEAQ